MKLKIGDLEIDGKILRKVTLILFMQGILIGAMVAAKQDGHHVSPALFIVVNIIVIPALARQLFKN